jgi:hypothetical protein
MNVFELDISSGRVESLVATAFTVIDILSNHFPIFDVEDLFSQNSISLEQAIKDKSDELLANNQMKKNGTGMEIEGSTYELLLHGLFAIIVS